MWDTCRLSGEAAAWRRRGALEALGPLIRLLGGKAFSRSGIHQPLLNEASLHRWPFPAHTCGSSHTLCHCEVGFGVKQVDVPLSS